MDQKELESLKASIRLETLKDVRERMRGINFGSAFSPITPMQFMTHLIENSEIESRSVSTSTFGSA